MKKTFVFIFAFLLTQSHASAQSQVVVKIFSGLCGQNESKFVGSGALVRRDSRLFVLTSNHVVLNGNGPYCHRIENQFFGQSSARLVVSDWSIGLALLEVNAKSEKLKNVLTLPLRKRMSVNEEKVVTTGFPAQSSSRELFVSSQGYVLQAASARHWLGTSTPMTELMNAYASFGMSGGPVLNADSSQIIGVLSHQAIVTKLGRSESVENFSTADSNGKQFNHVFMIPSDVAINWMNSMGSEKPLPLLSEVASEQIQGRTLVTCGDLQFATVKVTPAGIGGEGGANGSGIGGEGGANGSGIGGSDEGGANGSGIGGGLESKSVPVSVSLTPAEARSSSQCPYASDPWYQSVKKALQLQNKIVIPFLVKRDPNSYAPVRVAIEGLEHFFRKLAEPQYSPVPTTVNKVVQEIGSEGVFASEDIRSRCKRILVVIDELNVRASKIEEKQILSRMRVNAEMLLSSEWQNIQRAELTQFTDMAGIYAKAWTQLFSASDNHKYDLSVELAKTINELIELIR